MREILFRGRDLETGKWAYGYFVYCASTYDNPETDRVAEIIALDADRIYTGEYSDLHVSKVDINTVSQWTGLTDVNGNKIFDGDVIRCVFDNMVRGEIRREKFITDVKFGVHFGSYGFYLGNKRSFWSVNDAYDSTGLSDVEVIGNIWDDPELLEECEQCAWYRKREEIAGKE